MKNIYVGNLSYQATEDELRDAFSEFGTVSRVSVIIDRETGRSRGFAFVEMPNDGEAEAAIQNLNDVTIAGRPVRVNEAKPQEPRVGGGAGRGPRRF